jgi:hypothetical protein
MGPFAKIAGTPSFVCDWLFWQFVFALILQLARHAEWQ